MILETDNLDFSYDRRNTVLKNISFALEGETVTALAGVNGCGKSTLLKCMAGLHKPTKGEIRLDGVPLNCISRRELAKHLAFLPQHPLIPAGFTVSELVMCGRYPHNTPHRVNIQKTADIMDITGISHLADRQLSTLSGGECQRCFLAMALAQEPEIMLLDEPFSALDPAAAGKLFQLLLELKKQYSLTVVIVLHDINRALRCSDRIIGIKQGQMIFDLAPGAAENKIPELYDLPENSCLLCSDGRKIFL